MNLQKLDPMTTKLNLEGTEVTDADLAHLTGLTALTHLNLGNTSVTDCGLERLRGLLKGLTILH